MLWLVAAAFVIGAVLGAGAQKLLAATAGDGSSGPEASTDRRPDGRDTQADLPTTTSTTTAAPAPPAPPADPPPPVDQVAVSPGRVFVAGDSVTLQAMLINGPGEGAPADLQTVANLGWTVEQVQPELDTAMAADPPGTLVVALGLNDSSLTLGGDGWSDADLLRFQGMIATPDPRACVVLVLPGHGPEIEPQYAAELAEARLALVELATERRSTPGSGPTVVVDWQAEVDARPWLLSSDGIHLASDPATGEVTAEAAAARTDLYWQGVGQCRDGGG